MTILLTSITLAALSMPPQFVLDTIEGGTVHGKRDCIWRGERSTCIMMIHRDKPYSIVIDGANQLRYVLTLRNGNIVEVWSHDSKEA